MDTRTAAPGKGFRWERCEREIPGALKTFNHLIRVRSVDRDTHVKNSDELCVLPWMNITPPLTKREKL